MRHTISTLEQALGRIVAILIGAPAPMLVPVRVRAPRPEPRRCLR